MTFAAGSKASNVSPEFAAIGLRTRVKLLGSSTSRLVGSLHVRTRYRQDYLASCVTAVTY